MERVWSNAFNPYFDLMFFHIGLVRSSRYRKPNTKYYIQLSASLKYNNCGFCCVGWVSDCKGRWFGTVKIDICGGRPCRRKFIKLDH